MDVVTHLISSGWRVLWPLSPGAAATSNNSFRRVTKSRMPYSEVVHPIVKYCIHQSWVQIFCHSSRHRTFCYHCWSLSAESKGTFQVSCSWCVNLLLCHAFRSMKNIKITVETARTVYKVESQVKHPDLARGGGKDSRKHDSWGYRRQRKCFWKVGLSNDSHDSRFRILQVLWPPVSFVDGDGSRQHRRLQRWKPFTIWAIATGEVA